ncbi:MAG: anti-sigma factor domain-containing protein [Thermomicrobiales bacterium]
MTCEVTRELLDLYALGALDDAEARNVAAHVEGCPACRQALAQAEAAVAQMPLALASASRIQLPPDLRARVFASATEASRAPSGAVASASTLRSKSTPTVAWINRRRLAVAAAVLILVASLGWSVRLSQALDRERSVRESMSDLASQQQEIVIEVLDAPDGETRFLAPLSDESTAYGKVYTRSDIPDVVVMANRLPPPPGGMAYHVWLTVDGRTVYAGALPLSDKGFGVLIHEASRPGPVYDAVQITLQPTEPSEPGGEVVLRWTAE